LVVTVCIMSGSEVVSMADVVRQVWSEAGDVSGRLGSDERACRVLALAERFDAASAELDSLGDGALRARRDAVGDVPYLVGHGAQLSVLSCRLAARVRVASEQRDAVVGKVGKLHDPKAPDALALVRDVNGQVALMQEATDKQVRKLDQVLGQLGRLVSAREQEARQASRRTADREVIVEASEAVEVLRQLANESAILIRQDRLER